MRLRPNSLRARTGNFGRSYREFNRAIREISDQIRESIRESIVELAKHLNGRPAHWPSILFRRRIFAIAPRIYRITFAPRSAAQLYSVRIAACSTREASG
jgi:methyl coenzyme M reductase subunit C-like uncharacterized protein (methanogenesis marker protein 7)